MDRQKAKRFREAFQEAVAGLQEEFGTIELGNISFYNDGLTSKLTLTEKSEDGETITKAGADFKRYAFRYGMTEDDLGKEFVFRGERHTITGCKPKSHKYPILGKRLSDGREYKFTADTVRRGMEVSTTH